MTAQFSGWSDVISTGDSGAPVLGFTLSPGFPNRFAASTTVKVSVRDGVSLAAATYDAH